MASTYKTPGVYVEEISKFPPSIASVETAIPAFIGYTEWAKKTVNGDLLRKPVRIAAIADYERFFGGPDLELGFEANITDTVDPVTGVLSRSVAVPVPAKFSPFQLFYSVRLYFTNGGGPCYIISVGNYKDSGLNPTVISVDDLGNNSSGTGGLDVLELEDEPTLILFPDAQALAPGQYYSLCQASLAQCNKLQNRFSILDTLGDEDTAPSLFRSSIGTDFLKYGAVYYPFLETAYTYAYDETQVKISQSAAKDFAQPLKLTTDVNLEKAKIVLALATINASNAKTLADAVLLIPVGAANDKDDKLDAMDPLKLEIDDIKIQVDAVVSAVQEIRTKTNTFNGIFLDPDITTELSKIDISVYNDLATKMVDFSQAITDAKVVGNPITAADIDNNIINPLIKTISNAAVPKGLKETITELDAILIPNLITAIEGNDPEKMTTLIGTKSNSIQNSKNAIEAIKINNVEASVTGAVSDAAALNALKADVLNSLNSVEAEVNSTKSAITDISSAALNLSQIPFLQKLLSGAKQISLTNIQAIAGKLTQMKSDIGAATAATSSRDDVNKLATDYTAIFKELLTESKLIAVNLSNLVNTINYLNIDKKTLSEIKQIDNTSYNQVKQEIEKIPVILPPCGAVAGKYAQVDRDRGVWKAPANVSLLSVLGPTVKVNNDIHDGLNVDPVGGKSVNVIRSFKGKGIMVRGARTLSGNDNEWRFVSVRRFFIFAEESIKKATDQLVFEPNDANTWVKVRAMIENWLVLQWRAGALAGSKPEDAFYVRVGLSQTMTAVDILEGRMNVEIGMAVVRPAEFIVLKFSHKMQES